MGRWHSISIDEILAKITGAKVRIVDTLFYTVSKTYIDFAPDDLINKRAVDAAIGGAGSKDIPLTKQDFTTIDGGNLITHLFTVGELALIGNIEPQADFYVLDVVNGISSPSNLKGQFTHTGNDIAQPINGIYFEGLDASVWAAGIFKVVIRPALSFGQTVSVSGVAQYQEVATYADMIALGPGGDLTIFKIAIDESKGDIANTQYNYWPDGTAPIFYGSGSGSSLTFLENATSIALNKATLNATYPFLTEGDIVFCENANYYYLKKDNTPAGNWTEFPYQGNIT